MLKGKKSLGWIVIFCIILLFEAVFVFSGCGGGGSSALTGGGASGATGSFNVSINWPSGAGGSKLDLGKSTVLKTIPENTSYVTVEVVDSSTLNSLIPSVKVNRTPDVSNNTVTIDSVPVGNVQVRVKAFDSGDNLVAYGSANTNVVSGSNPPVAVSLTPGATPTESPSATPSIWVYVRSENDNIPPTASPSFTATTGESIEIFSESPLPAGTYTVSKDGGSPVPMTPQGTPVPSNYVSGTYFFGSQPTSVAGPLYLPFPPNATKRQYGLDLSLTGGSELGTYQINVNGTIVSQTQNLPVPSQLAITSPSDGSYVSHSSPITVSWTGIGPTFVYQISAEHLTSVFGSAATMDYLWSVIDTRNINFANPYTWTSYFLALSSHTSVTIPANMFQAGTSIRVHLMGFDNRYAINPASSTVGTVKAATSEAFITLHVQ